MQNIYQKINKLITQNKLAHLYIFDTKKIFNTKVQIAKLIFILNDQELPDTNLENLDLQSLFPNIYYLDGSIEKLKKDTIESFFNNLILNNIDSKYKYKIAIIENLENTQKESLNKILKEIEEPSDNIVFFLFSKKPKELLPTILSRAQLLQLETDNDEIYTNDGFSVIAKSFSNYDQKLIHEYSSQDYKDLFLKYIKTLKNIIKNKSKFSLLYLDLNEDLSKENHNKNKFILNILKYVILGIQDNSNFNKNKYIMQLNNLKKDLWNSYPRVGNWIKDINNFFQSLKLNANFKIQKQVLLLKLGEVNV